MRKLCFSKFARLPSQLFSYDAHCHLVSSLWLFSFSASDSEIESDSEEPRRSQPVAAKFSPQVMKKSKVLLSASLYRESLFWARGRGFKPSQTANHSRVLNCYDHACLLWIRPFVSSDWLSRDGAVVLNCWLCLSYPPMSTGMHDVVILSHRCTCVMLAHPRL